MHVRHRLKSDRQVGRETGEDRGEGGEWGWVLLAASAAAVTAANSRLRFWPVPEIIDPVFAKTSQNARFLLSENERFGLVFVKTGSINSGTVQFG